MNIAMETILYADGLYKTYQTDSGEVHAVNGVSVEFLAGRFYAIIGKSGSGKSTLLHMLGGLDKPTKGSVLYRGKDIFQYSDEQMAVFRRRQMGFVFQQYNLLEEYRVLRNICLPLELDGRKADRQFLKEVVGLLHLEKKLDKYPSELSGGEQQRVAIARSVISEPRMILADEPTGNLDKKTGEEVLALLGMAAKRFGQTLILVTHDLDIARSAEQVIHIEDGRIV